jgi:hypothetical protein
VERPSEAGSRSMAAARQWPRVAHERLEEEYIGGTMVSRSTKVRERVWDENLLSVVKERVGPEILVCRS